MNFSAIRKYLPAKFFGVLPLQSGVELILIYNAINKMSGLFGLLSLFTSHPINFIQWVYYTLNCLVLIATVFCFINVRKLVSQSLVASSNTPNFLNQESNIQILEIIAVFVIVYIAEFFTGNMFMFYLTNLWFEEEYNSESSQGTSSKSGTSSHLVKRVSDKLSLQSASETYEVFVSLITIIVTEVVRVYFISVVLSYYLRLRKRISRQTTGPFAYAVEFLDKLLN